MRRPRVRLTCCGGGARVSVRRRTDERGASTYVVGVKPLSLLVGMTGVAALCSCASLLPSTRLETVSTWNSYDDAEKAIAAFVPYAAKRQDVHKYGLDPRSNPSITVLHYADVLSKFTAAAMIRTGDVDRGIRDCLQAGKHCSGYAISVKKRSNRREGNFWLDSLNFRRETTTEGWSVEALLVFVNDDLVYELIGGQPTIHEFEVRHNPLGPLQGWADRKF